jgi:site-specific DNA recombinase
MKTKYNNCVIYSRVSTEKQSNESAIDDLTRYANYMQYNILRVFQEKITGTSKTADRIAYKELVNFCEENQVHHILVWEISRLSRRGLIDTLEIIKYFTERKINIYAKKENINTLNEDMTANQTSKMTLGIMGSVAEFGRTTIIESSKRGLNYHLKKGGAFSLSPFGYGNKNKMIVIDENESKTVKRIYQLFIDGKSSPAIAKILNANNILTKKGVKWSDFQIRDILHNPMYYGKRQYNFGVVDVPAIVKEYEYLKVQELFKNNSNLNKDKAIFTNNLSGLIKCGKCGLPYFQHARKSKRDFAYKCLSNRKVITGQLSESCGNKGININLLNSMAYISIINDLLKYIGTNQLEGIIKNFKIEIKQEKEKIRQEIKTLKSEIEKYGKKLYRLTSKAIDYNIPKEEYNERRYIIENVINNNQIKLNQLLIKEADNNKNSKDVKYYSTLKNNLKSMGIEATDNSLLVDVDLYRYYCKSMIKSIIISNTDVKDNINLTTIIPNIHHQRLVKVSVTTLLNTYIFYTVNAFSNYTFEVLENELNKLDLIDVVKQ